MAKHSSVKAFLGSIEGICLIESVLRKALRPYKDVAPTDPERWATFQIVTEQYLKVTEACRAQLKADIAAQREFEELKRALESGLTAAEVERTLELHFENRGWGSLDAARSMLFTYLTEEGLSREQAKDVVDNGLPKRRTRPERTPVAYKLRQGFKRMESALAEGAQDLHVSLGDRPDVHEGSPGGMEGGTGTESSEGLPGAPGPGDGPKAPPHVEVVPSDD